ncbi:MAG: hypothetical protein M8866_12320 [marine benthic group bacterium]|nr:hypothetical protein [Candidatus Benthicola marisminoris]
MSRRREILLSVVSAALIFGCSGDSTGPPPEPQPQPGELSVTLSSGVSVGGVVLTVTGGAMSSPAASGGAELYYDLSGTTLKATVLGTSLSGDVLGFSVPDVRDVASYQVVVDEAAGTSNQTLPAGGITVSVER